MPVAAPVPPGCPGRSVASTRLSNRSQTLLTNPAQTEKTIAKLSKTINLDRTIPSKTLDMLPNHGARKKFSRTTIHPPAEPRRRPSSDAEYPGRSNLKKPEKTREKKDAILSNTLEFRILQGPEKKFT